MKFKKILQKSLNEGEVPTVDSVIEKRRKEKEKKQKRKEALGRGESTRQASGQGFEDSFEDTYFVTKEGLTKNQLNANISLKVGGKFPEMKDFQNIGSSGVENINFAYEQDDFRLFKCDFWNHTKKLHFVKIDEEGNRTQAEPDKNFTLGGEGGSYFELKNENLKANANIIYSQHKRVSTKTSFISIFGNEGDLEEFKEIKTSDRTTQIETWNRIRDRITSRKNFTENKQNHNFIIDEMIRQAQAFINGNKEIIKNGIMTDLGNKNWVLVTKGKDFSFNKIDVAKFVSNINLLRREYLKVAFAQVNVTNDMLEESYKTNGIKKQILESVDYGISEGDVATLERPATTSFNSHEEDDYEEEDSYDISNTKVEFNINLKIELEFKISI